LSIKCSYTRTAAHQALEFKLAIGFENRVGVYGQPGNDFPRGGQLVARDEKTEAECLFDLMDQLQVKRDT
jgi:hypothetical protein